MNRREFFRRTAGAAAIPIAAVVGAAVPSDGATGGFLIPRSDGSLLAVETTADLESSLAAMKFRADLAIYKAKIDADIARGVINEQRMRDNLTRYVARIESVTETLKASGQTSAALAAGAMSAIHLAQ